MALGFEVALREGRIKECEEEDEGEEGFHDAAFYVGIKKSGHVG